MGALPLELVETWDQGEVVRHFLLDWVAQSLKGILRTTRSMPPEVSSDAGPQAFTGHSGAP